MEEQKLNKLLFKKAFATVSRKIRGHVRKKIKKRNWPNVQLEGRGSRAADLKTSAIGPS